MGPTGPTGTFEVGDPLFTVESPGGSGVITFGDTLRLEPLGNTNINIQDDPTMTSVFFDVLPFFNEPNDFSAFTSGTVAGITQIGGWTTAPPPYYNFFGFFEPALGTYNVPRPGVFSVYATICYNLTATPTTSTAANPYFSIRNLGTGEDLISGVFPILDLNFADFTGRSVLGAGTVTLAGDLQLNGGFM